MSLRGKGIAACVYIGLEIGLGIGVLIDKRNECYIKALYWAGAKNVRIEHGIKDKLYYEGLEGFDPMKVVKDYKTYNKIIKEIKKKGYSNVDADKIAKLRTIEAKYELNNSNDIS